MSATSSPYLAPALDSSEWLLSNAIEMGEGLAWPDTPGGEPDRGLYSGTPGVVLALLDAYGATGEERFLAAARRGCLYLGSASSEEELFGFYVGEAGIGFALREMANVTGDASDAAAADRLLALVCVGATVDGDRAWWGPVTDIIVGSAGTGLWLLHEGELELAAAAGRHLIDQGITVHGGRMWKMTAEFEFSMPNFSHGTAGVAYFLASLAAAGAGDEFLDAAVDGAAYLRAMARRDDGGFSVFHFEPGGEELFPLGWCHGPTGTARLFHRLAQVTDDSSWAQLRDCCAHTVRTSGIPEQREPGFWDNVAACCGSAGVARFFLDLYRATGDDDHLAFAQVMSDDILTRATTDATGTRWSNIEPAADDPVLAPRCGAMQGAAGISSWLIELDAFLMDEPRRRTWPDSPF